MEWSPCLLHHAYVIPKSKNLKDGKVFANGAKLKLIAVFPENNGSKSQEDEESRVNGGTACEEEGRKESSKEFEELPKEANKGSDECDSEGSELYSNCVLSRKIERAFVCFDRHVLKYLPR